MKRIFTLFVSLTFFSWISQAQPSTQATNVVFSQGLAATSLNVSWTTGNGTNKLVVISSGGGVFTPVNSTDYTADTSPNFSVAVDKDGGAGVAKIVYGGTANTITVSNLVTATFYTVNVYEFTLAGFLYNVTTATNNPMVAWFANANTNYTVPAGVTSIRVQAWGGGGAGGGSGSATNGRAGGGGGAYVAGTITTTPTTVYAAAIGAGGPASAANGAATTFGGGALFSADFGTGGANSADDEGLGGLATISVVVGTATSVVKTNGSNGGNRANPSGGVGGDAGNAAGTGGAANASANGSPGKVAGGGGAGAGLNSEGGAGGNGFVIVSYVSGDTTPPAAFTVGSVTTTGGTVVAGKWNSTNTGLDVVIPLSNSDASLDNGTVQLRVQNTTNTGYINIPVSGLSTITNGERVAGTKTMSVTAANLEAAFSALQGFIEGTTLQITAIMTDVSGNPTTGTQSGTSIAVDQLSPTAFTVGSLTTIGGTVVAARWNSTNTGLDVVIPLSNTDASLDNGTVQLRVQNTTNTGYIDIPTSGLSTITNGQRVAGTKTISVTAAHLEAAFSGVQGFIEGTTLQITAVVTDSNNNPATTGTQSATTLLVDQISPAAFTVGSLTTTGGTVLAGKWNTTNTGLDVVIPLSNIDASLDGGSIQLQVQNTTTTGYINIPTSGLSAITNPQRVAGTKTISVTAANLEAAFSGAQGFIEGTTLEITAIITDANGNPATTGTQSATSIVVEQVLPSAFTVGSLTVTGGTVQAGKWNSTNTGLDIVVPLDNADATLDLGSVQLQVQNTTNTGYINIPVSGLSTITNGERVAGTKTISVTAANLEAAFSALQGFIEGTTLQITAIMTDVNGNPTTGTQSGTSIAVDQLSPTAFTVGSLTTIGGTVVAARWNSTNTGLDVVIPLSNTDASLDNGTVQLRVQNTTNTGYIDIPTSGLSTITNGQRVAGTKTISVTAANLEAAFSGVQGFIEGTTLQITAVVTDSNNNPATTGTQSATTLLVDQISPAAFTVGSLTTTGGTVLAGKWNSTNTGLDVVIPLSNTDASLDGGSIQLQVQNTTTTGYINIPTSGLSAITNPQRVAGTKTISVTAANLEAAFSGAQGFVEGTTLEIMAIMTDANGNPATTGTQSATSIVVEQVVPSAFTVGSLTTTGGTVIATYWNSTNTGLDVVVPLSNADASLDNGTVQLRVQNTTTTGYIDIPTSGLSTITNAERLAATKTVSVTASDLEAAFSGLQGFQEATIIQITGIITDVNGNATTGTQSATSLNVDQTLPIVVDDLMSLTIPLDKIDFSLSEEITLAEAAAATGFSVANPVTLSTQVYSGKGTTNLITLTAPSGSWSVATTVSYSPGNIVDLAGNPLATIVAHVVTVSQPATLAAGDLAITSYKSDDPDEFTVLFLKDVPSGIAIKFTDNGWRTSGSSFTTAETTLTLTTSRYVFAGTEIKVVGTTVTPASTVTVTGSALSISSTNGDQILVYQGLASSPTFITALNMNGTWANPADGNDQVNSNLPMGLTDNTHALAFTTEVDNAAYNFLVGGPANTALTPALLLAKIMTDATGTDWTRNDNPASVTFPTITTGDNYILPPSLSTVFPANGSTSSASPNLVITFDENVLYGTSAASAFNDFELRRVSDNALIQSWNIGSGTFSNPAGVSPTATLTGVPLLTNGAQYEVNVKERVFRNTFFNYSTGVTGSSIWRFTADAVLPTVSSIVRNTPAASLTNATTLVYTVTFNEDIDASTFTDADLTKTLSGVTVGTATITETTATSGIFTVSIPTVSGNGTVQIDLLPAATINDVAGNDYNSTFNTGQIYTIDQATPTVTSIVRNTPATASTNATTIVYTVTFNEDIDATTFTDTDLTKTLSGVTVGTATITETSATSGIFTVSIPTVSGNGTVRIDLLPAATINDAAGNDYNSTFNTGEVYTIDQTPPAVTSIVRNTPTSPTNATSVTFTVTFNDDIDATTFTDADLTKTVTATAATVGAATIAETTPTSGVFTVTLPGVSGDGTIRLDLLPAASINDDVGNDYNATFNTGETFTIDNTAPTYVSITRQSSINGYGGPGGTSAISTISRLTFSEDVIGIEYSAGPNNNVTGVSTGAAGSVTFGSFSGALSTTTNFVDITVGGLSGEGIYSLRFIENDDVTDLAGNPVNGVGFSDFFWNTPGNEYYTKVIPEPSSAIAALSVTTITSSSVTVQWSSPGAGQDPTHFLVMAKPNSTPTYPLPAGSEDGNYIADGTLAKNIVRSGSGLHSVTFNNLSSGVSYDFIIYPYTLYSPGNPGNIANNNVDYKTTTPATTTGAYPTGVLLPTAQTSTLALNTSNIGVSSILNDNSPGVNVFQFRLADDGYEPLSTNMALFQNATLAEKIIFNLAEELTLAEGANVLGFSTSTGSIASAIYSGKGTTNTVTLTSSVNGSWFSSTTVSYSSAGGNVQGIGSGNMLDIVGHAVVQAASIPLTYTLNNSFTVPAGVTTITVEAWGGGGSGGGYSSGINIRGGGGGGGAYSRRVLTVTPNSVYNVTVGLGATCCSGDGQAGGSSSFGGALVTAGGGGGGIAGDSGASGGAGGALGIGDVSFPGGFGANGNSGSGIGGGGGSSAGTNSAGSNGGTNGAAGIAPSGGGNGGFGVSSGSAQSGFFPGGGGGGTGTGGSGSFGANGMVTVTYEDPTLTSLETDNAPFRFEQLVIGQQTGTGNSDPIDDWTTVIGGAELSDGTTTISGEVLANQIRFGYPANPLIVSDNSGDFGFIDDAGVAPSFKDYTLKIWVLNPLSDALAAQVDNLTLGFEVTPTGFALNNNSQASSRFLPAQSTLNSSNVVDVDATALVFQKPGTPSPTTDTNPPAQIGVGIPFSAVSGKSTAVYSLDANNNLDLDYTNVSANITNPAQGYGQSFGSAKFINGKLDLSSFYFTTGTTVLGNTTLLLVDDANVVTTDQPSTAVVPVISSLTTVTAGPTAEPGILPALTTALSGASAPQLNAIQNFDFTIKDDDGANSSTFADNDNLPTRINSITIRRPLAENGTVIGGVDFDAWTKSIAGATLRLGSTIVPATATIFDDRIEFTGIPNNPHINAYVASNSSDALEIVNLTNPLVPVHRGSIQNATLLNGALSTFVSGKYAYTTSNLNNSLSIVDISNPAAPVMVSTLTNGTGGAILTNAAGVYVSGNFAYVTCLSGALEIVNVSNPAAPVHAGSITDGTGGASLVTPYSVYVSDNYAYVASFGGDYLEIVDVSNPSAPAHAGKVPITAALSVFVQGDYAYVASYSPGNSFVIVNISNPSAPTIVGTLPNGGGALLSGPFSVTVSGKYAYVVSLSSNALEIVDISNPAAPVHTGSLSGLSNPRSVKVLGNYAYISNFSGSSLVTVDVSNPTAPVLAGTLNNGVGGALLTNPWGIFVSGTASGEEGFIPDGQSKTYSLSIWLKNPVDVALQDKLDGEDFVFEINNKNDFGITSTPGNLSSTISPVTLFNSSDGNNAVSVVATQLDFTTQPAATQNYDINLTTTPVVKARDANQNLDLNYTSGATLSPIFIPAAAPNNVAHTYPLSNNSFTFVGGIATLSSVVVEGNTGTGIHDDNIQLRLDDTPDVGSVSSGQSSTIQLKYEKNSTIVHDGFSHPTNIVTINNREAVNLTAANSIVLDRFLLKEGGTSNDTDGSKTKLQSITLNLTNHQNIQRIALYDETNAELQELDFNSFSVSGDITFSSFVTPFEANDDDRTTKKFTVRVSFRNVVDDNEIINVSIVSVAAAGNSSQFVPALTVPGDVLGTNDNKVEVVATQIDYTTIDATASISVPVTAQVSARDLFGNVDTDYNGSITATETSPSSDLLFHTLNEPTGAFAAGLKNYPATFQFDVGDGNVQLTMSSSAGSTAGESVDAGAISGTSPIISVISSYESQLVSDNINFAPTLTQDIDFINYQATTDITTTSATTTNGYTLDLLNLYDGGRSDITDLDGAATSLDDLTLGLSNWQSIKRIAIYTKDPITGNVAEVKDYDITDPALSPTTVNGYRTITFTNLNIVAPDNDPLLSESEYTQILVLATFQSTPATITDRDDIKVAVLGATLNTGSKFAPDLVQTGTIGGVATSTFTFPEATAPVTVGTLGYLSKLQVTATSLDFEDDTFTLKQPSDLAGKAEPIDGSPGTSPGGNTGIVYARDKFGIIDTDFTGAAGAATVTAGAVPIGYPSVFVNGVLNLVGMRYQNAGDGTLRVTAGGLDSNVPGVGNIGNYTPSTTVDVLHVKAVHDVNTVEPLQSLKGGTTNKRIFGFDFSAEHSTATEPNLTGFSITFKDDVGQPYPYTKGPTDNVFKNFKLFIAEGAGAPTALTEGADYTLTQDQSFALTQVSPTPTAAQKDRLTFVLTNPAPLYQSNYRFYLNVDVDVNVGVGTDPITPYLEDAGYSFQTNDHIKTTVGSSTAFVQGITRKFASTKPPVLVSTSPANGKLNVDPGLNTIRLTFDVPVATFDGEIKVYNRETGTLRATFASTNGKYVDGTPLKDQVVPFLDFAAPIGFDFQPDTVYYVTIEKGVFSNTDVTQRKGISDEGFNLYGGISYSGTFYFKGSSLLPPKLISTDASKYYYTPTSATFNFKFDKPGKVHYMVVHPTLPAPAPATVTNDQILGITPYTTSTIVARGTTTIDQISPNLQFSTINAALTNGIDYFVYAFAENDAEPTPVKTGAPIGAYGAYVLDTDPTNDFVIGNAGPTLKIKKTAGTTNQLNNPRFEICINSSVKMEEPIIISESVLGEFSGAGTQSFNILLPTGFQYDVTKAPTVVLNGLDFGTLPVGTNLYRYRNSALLEINFVNALSATLDNIIISDLYLIASSADIGGNIVRFGGNGLPTVPDDRVLARITSGPASSIPFTNSYDEANKIWPYSQISTANPYKPITYIPDNFASTVRLIPVAPTGDYGSSFFSGAGLTNDVLTLSAVNPDASFNISLTHTDQTGCATTTVEQYLVYDHTKTIPELLKVTSPGVSYTITGTKIGLMPGAPDPVTNIPGVPLATLSPNDSVSYLGLAGYQLIDLFADIPVRAKNLPNPQVLDYNDNGWKALVNNIPRLKFSKTDNNLNQTFKSYRWEYSDLINKNSTTTASVEYPYDPAGRFARTVQSAGTGNGKTYFEPGSLGIMEFTGVYQSTADFSVFIPFRQEVELFIPAVPVVEVDGESSNSGATPIFCESGSAFIVTGYPLANSSEVTGFFTLKDSVSNAVIVDAGFVDNGNGTASFNPSSLVLKNSYKTIKVEYTFKQNDSPAVGTGALYIRVTPNPVANFITSTLCEDLNVTFTDTTVDPIPGDVTIAKWLWSFGDPSSANNSDNVQNPVHMYSDSRLYTPITLGVTTNFNCQSVAPKSVSLQIGGTPAVNFNFNGVSVNDQISFTNTSTVSANDTFGQLDWTFGDGASNTITSNFNAVEGHNYGSPKEYDVNLKVTSAIGCINDKTQRIVVLSNATPTSIVPYFEGFETNNGMWITSSLPTSSYSSNPSSWVIETPASSVITITDPVTFGNKVVKTTIPAGTSYRSGELSAWYSPSFDLSQLARPMISFNSFTQMEVSDGVIVQYSIDNKNVADPTKKWDVLGDKLGEGVDWFDNQGIAAKPGNQPGQDYAWSGFNQSAWAESKHVITNSTDPLKAQISGKTQVVFRFALASVAPTITHDGFAMDNFRIGERTRTILLENFTTTDGKSNNGVIRIENTFVSSFENSGLGTTVVKLNYHIGFTGVDPFNLDNPADPSARALYYNVKEVPWAFLDGGRTSEADATPKFSEWGQQAYNTQTLQLGQAKITTNTPTINTDGSIKFDVSVTALYDLPDNTILHVAIIEKSVLASGLSQAQRDMIKTGEGNFDFVLKKMLPNATGTKFGTPLAKDASRTFPGFEYFPDAIKLYSNPNDLAIIVFLQNEVDRTIYQTELITGFNDPPIVTGLENTELLEHMEIFPNPADKEFIIQLPGAAKQSMEIQLVDQVGKVVNHSSIPEGVSRKTISSQDLAAGIYILQIGSGKSGVVRKKVLVVHQD